MRNGRIVSEVFLRDDIENMLKAVDRANASLANYPLLTEEVAIYRAGFIDAMQAVAAAFGISFVESRNEIQTWER